MSNVQLTNSRPLKKTTSQEDMNTELATLGENSLFKSAIINQLNRECKICSLEIIIHSDAMIFF